MDAAGGCEAKMTADQGGFAIQEAIEKGRADWKTHNWQRDPRDNMLRTCSECGRTANLYASPFFGGPCKKSTPEVFWYLEYTVRDRVTRTTLLVTESAVEVMQACIKNGVDETTVSTVLKEAVRK